MSVGPVWSEKYPDPAGLKREVTIAADTFVTALEDAISAGDIVAIYLKGSAVKTWDSPLDYVPWLSDVDIHVLFAEEDIALRHVDLRRGLALSAHAEELFHAAISSPIHVPRIQMLVANGLYSSPDYVPSPAETVELKAGKPYAGHLLEPAKSRAAAIRFTLQPATAEYLATLTGRVADLTGPHLRRVLRDLSWRVSPAGPQILELKGIPFHTAWTSNRTAIVELLASCGEEQMAAGYAAFYVNAWAYFLSRDADGNPARMAILAAYQVLNRAIEIAQACH